ncbi:MAG: TerB family tellurite resistance protein [Ignavibacteriaceae bacterium]|nr:TerB family tellurite resistance protein [Ignavibacteriaceae bacterium]
MSKFFDLAIIRKITSSSPKKAKDDGDRIRQTQLASCAILLGMAKSDNDFSEDEKARIVQILQKTFHLDEFEVEDLIHLSEQQMTDSGGLETFAGYINEHYDIDEKFELVKDIWRVVYSDEELHTHEQEMIRKIMLLLNLDNRMIGNAKEDVRRELGLLL